MKICYLAPANSIHTVKWINAFCEKGYEIELITMHSPSEQKINKSVNIHILPFKSGVGYYLNFIIAKKLLRKIKPDILHVHYASGYGTLSRLIGFKNTLLSIWGSDILIFPEKNVINKFIIKRNLKHPKYLACTSKVLIDKTRELLGEKKDDDKDKVFHTPFGIDTEFFQRSKVKNGNDLAITIGIVKSLKEVYGIDILIKAISLLIEDLINEGNKDLALKIRLKIIGSGSAKNGLVNLCESKGIRDITEFIDKIPNNEVPIHMNELDIYCNPSRSESFGVSVLEASSCGLPVVVSNVGGLPEVVIPNKTGVILDENNESTLANTLKFLILEPEKRELLGENGRDFVVETYNQRKCIENLENVYKSMEVI
jgi:L-malate glycosyltransferase